MNWEMLVSGSSGWLAGLHLQLGNRLMHSWQRLFWEAMCCAGREQIQVDCIRDRKAYVNKACLDIHAHQKGQQVVAQLVGEKGAQGEYLVAVTGRAEYELEERGTLSKLDSMAGQLPART